ncbi:hypothetical protein ACIGB6_17390 [Paeniglutamicibacter gangotriensis]|uniref:Uncharacterized protein n=2 Tax=Paeniglutamicibacter gangotriensis TaxID=254787 RepID=M7MWQ2_9MICC|nr:hypothetical protein [Paeniglutamicibacter gangotriensis]EMQ99501.1 hypothetical protein ADIAG_01497 [Paeniglutamicibacter gangotriensis Lz1y]KAA0978852.1 hypothetical protein FQ154_03585 [Paeniglutamicibacter gangotriensis]
MLARDYIGDKFRSLHLLRLFLPAHDRSEAPLRWSSLLPPGAELEASADWNELWCAFLVDHPGTELPDAPLGGLDRETAAALREILGAHLDAEVQLHTRSWIGHSRPFTPQALTSLFHGREYLHEDLGLEGIIFRGVRDQVPEFVEDPHHAFAWGTCLYPDSLVIAAAPALFRALHQDPRLEVVSIVSHRDILPAPFDG